jgi:hypothetical protein
MYDGLTTPHCMAHCMAQYIHCMAQYCQYLIPLLNTTPLVPPLLFPALRTGTWDSDSGGAVGGRWAVTGK